MGEKGRWRKLSLLLPGVCRAVESQVPAFRSALFSTSSAELTTGVESQVPITFGFPFFGDNCCGEWKVPTFSIRFVFHFLTADWHLSELVIGPGWTSNSCTRPWLWVILMTSPISFNNSFQGVINTRPCFFQWFCTKAMKGCGVNAKNWDNWWESFLTNLLAVLFKILWKYWTTNKCVHPELDKLLRTMPEGSRQVVEQVSDNFHAFYFKAGQW